MDTPTFDDELTLVLKPSRRQQEQAHMRLLRCLIDGVYGTNWERMDASYNEYGGLRRLIVTDVDGTVLVAHPASPVIRAFAKAANTGIYGPQEYLEGARKDAHIDELFGKWDRQEEVGELEVIVNQTYEYLLWQIVPHPRPCPGRIRLLSKDLTASIQQEEQADAPRIIND